MGKQQIISWAQEAYLRYGLEGRKRQSPRCCGWRLGLIHILFCPLDPPVFASENCVPMRRQTIAEARWILAILVVLAFVSLLFSVWLFVLSLILIAYTFYFFRDPNRDVSTDANAIVAAADGTITDIVEIEETDVLKSKTRRVGIFLSIFDVHTNR